jgi:hypothetical protein
MELNEDEIGRWLDRGSRFFKTVARNPVVRGELLARGLTDEELAHGWQLYSDLHGFASPLSARAAVGETAAAQAINEIDAWDAPAFSAARAVLEARIPEVARFLFDNLEPSVGVAAVAGVERFLDRLAALRDGKATGIDAASARAAVELLATRKIVDPAHETKLRTLIQTARRGAQPNEVVPAPQLDPARTQVANSFIAWLHEWREVARASIARRDYRISLGLAQRRQAAVEPDDSDPRPAV